jgi:hypothetical protein
MRKASAVVASLAAVIMAAGAAFAASRPVAYCTLPAGPAHPAWAFRVAAPIQTATGSYAHGRGTLSGPHATGHVCQVDRVATAPDRQIILKVTRVLVGPRHGAVLFGVPGNLMALGVRVTSSTDSSCHVGTPGTLTLFASFNGIKKDLVKFSFGRGCRSHNHAYTGPRVVALVPRSG